MTNNIYVYIFIWLIVGFIGAILDGFQMRAEKFTWGRLVGKLLLGPFIFVKAIYFIWKYW